MLLSLFSSLYEALIGPSTDYTDFEDHLFNDVGLLTLVVSAIICFVFYILLGRWKSVWYTRTHWALTILLCGLIGFCLAYFISRNALGIVDGYVIRFALFNALIAAIYFVILSFLFKPFSIFSKRTPL